MEKIKTIRDLLNLTQKEFSETLGITQSYLSALETGRKEASTKVIKKLFDNLNVSPEWWHNNRGDIFNITKNVLNINKNTLGNINGVKDGETKVNEPINEAEISKSDNEAIIYSMDLHKHEKRMKYFWDKVAVVDSEFYKSFDQYDDLETIIDLFRDYFRETSDIIEQHYQKIQNIDIKELKDKDTTEKLISEFIKSLSSIKQNGKHFEELIKLLKESPLIKYWED